MKKMYLSTIPENWKHKKKAEIMYKETQQQQQQKRVTSSGGIYPD